MAMERRLSRKASKHEDVPSDGHTGISLAFDDFCINPDEPPAALSKGVVCVVSRLEGKEIKPHAVQTSFFALPLDASEANKKAVEKKVREISNTYRANKYNVEKFEFDLPFEVGAICRVTKGYTSTPKAMQAVSAAEEGNKKKRKGSHDEASDEGEDNTEPCKKKRARK